MSMLELPQGDSIEDSLSKIGIRVSPVLDVWEKRLSEAEDTSRHRHVDRNRLVTRTKILARWLKKHSEGCTFPKWVIAQRMYVIFKEGFTNPQLESWWTTSHFK